MRPDQAQQRLLRALDAHSTRAKEEDIKGAFEAKNTQEAVVDWVQEFLGPETLISQEEAELYSKLEENGVARRIAASHDLSLVRPLWDDDEIRTASKALKASTLAIENHTRVLKEQQQALLSFQESNDQAHERWKRTAAQRLKKRIQEKQNIELAVEELSESTAGGTVIAQRQLHAANSVFPGTVAELLQKDDRILARIDRLVGELEVINFDDGQQISYPRMLREKLSTYLAKEIRCRLDRIYLETNQSPTMASETFSRDKVELSSLKAELDTLYSEITAVAEMATSLEFENPLIEAARQKKVQNEIYIGSVLDHIDHAIAHLLKKTGRVVKRAQIHASHRAALDAVANEIRTLHVSARQAMNSTKDKTGTHPFQLPVPHNPQLNLNRARLEAPNSPDTRRLLSILGIPPLDGLKTKDLEDVLDRTSSDKEIKTWDGSLTAEISVGQVISSYLNDCSSTQQTIVDALLADTAYHTVKMFDPELRSEISTLETDIGKIGVEMADLNLEKLEMASQERDQFVNQWAR